MDHDDRPVGTLLTRRDAVRVLAAAGLALGSVRDLFAQTPGITACVVRPELEEGPYFVDGRATRSDVRTDSATGRTSPGIPLTLTFAVASLTGGQCTPLRNASIDIWQCDAGGTYSGVSGAGQSASDATHDFLRGVQRTGSGGDARFVTIYPGWYPGRTVHTHIKIRTQGSDGQAYEFTSQLFYPEELTDRVHGQAPYAAHGRRNVTNARDGIFSDGGEQLLLQPVRKGDGYEATLAIALDLTDTRTARPDGGRRSRFGRGRGGAFRF